MESIKVFQIGCGKMSGLTPESGQPRSCLRVSLSFKVLRLRFGASPPDMAGPEGPPDMAGPEGPPTIAGPEGLPATGPFGAGVVLRLRVDLVSPPPSSKSRSEFVLRLAMSQPLINSCGYRNVSSRKAASA